jgi:hypothetical protein
MGLCRGTSSENLHTVETMTNIVLSLRHHGEWISILQHMASLQTSNGLLYLAMPEETSRAPYTLATIANLFVVLPRVSVDLSACFEVKPTSLLLEKRDELHSASLPVHQSLPPVSL